MKQAAYFTENARELKELVNWRLFHRIEVDEMLPEEKLREIELKVQREINEKRQELLAKEESLRNLESRLAAQGSQGDF